MTFFFLYTQFSSIIEKSHLMLNQLQNFLLHVHLNSGTEKFLTTIFNTSFFTLRSFFSSLFISNFCNYVTRNANIRKKNLQIKSNDIWNGNCILVSCRQRSTTFDLINSIYKNLLRSHRF